MTAARDCLACAYASLTSRVEPCASCDGADRWRQGVDLLAVAGAGKRGGRLPCEDSGKGVKRRLGQRRHDL